MASRDQKANDTMATVGLLASGVITMRSGLLRFLRVNKRSLYYLGMALNMLGILGGAFIFLLGTSLLRYGLHAPQHTLF